MSAFVCTVEVEHVVDTFVATCPALLDGNLSSRSVKSRRDAAMPLLKLVAQRKRLGVPAVIQEDGNQIVARWGGEGEGA